MSLPTFDLESRHYQQGSTCIAGLDEVGRGCLAGPVVAAAVVLDPKRIPKGIDDSKRLSAKKREKLAAEIREVALTYAIGVGEVEEIDRINILQASKLAMIRSIEGLKKRPDLLFLDGNFKIDSPIRQIPIIGGDRVSVSVGAASILAKVERDRWMVEFDEKYPGYDFASNKGYGSKTHRLALQKQGATPLHRKSFNWTPV